VLKLHLGTVDYVILAIYFAVVLGIGFIARLSIKSDLDFFLSGRSLPAWITGIAFIAANLGALEILGQSANGAQYGVPTVHYYWIGAVPAMVFLGLVMIPFYYGSKVRSVPEYLRLRFNEATHAFNAATFAVATVLISGVNLFALALIIHLMLGWSITFAILVAAALVLVYITLGGLTSAIYNEVLQFFVIVAALLPLTLVALHSVGGISGLKHKVENFKPLGSPGLHAWQGLAIHHHTNTLGSDWIGVVFGLGFVLGFGYWTTNFAEVQRALSAKNLVASRRTPLIGAIPKLFLPAIIILPGLIAVVTVHGLGGSAVNESYNTAIPHLIGNFLPEGMLGIAVTGLLAAFMAGVAANVTAFNTVVTYDIVQAYIAKDRDPAFYLRTGRWVTVAGILVSVGTAFIAKGYSNIMNYIQTLFSIFNAPLFATFIIAMFWKRATPWGGFCSLIAGTAAAYATNRLAAYHTIFHFGSATLDGSFWQAIMAFVVDAAVLVGVSLFTQPKPIAELDGLVWGMAKGDDEADIDPRDKLWWRSPWLLGGIIIACVIALNIIFI
jgi:solute:Na+ symporter, SSS family